MMRDLLKQGETFFSEQRFEEAKKCFLAVIEKDPLHKEAFNNLGVVDFKMGDRAAAFEWVTRALTLDPFYKEAILNFSEILRAMGQLHQILPFLEKTIQRYPNDWHYVNLLAEAKSNHISNGNREPVPAQKEHRKAFFVLSSGRCGTLTLARLLATSRNAKVHYYPKPQMFQEALQAYWGEIDKQKAFWSARSSLMRNTWAGGYIYGETSAFVTPFCHLLAEELPESRFIVLIRHPKDFVRSGLRQNFYHGHPSDAGLLRPSPKDEAFKGWEKQSQFEKICWFWRETYIAIEGMLEKVQKERVLVVRFEDLISNIEKVREIFEFLSLEGFSEQKAAEVLSAKLNAQDYKHFPEPESWSSDLNDLLQRLCWPTADKYGYSLSEKRKPLERSLGNDSSVRASALSHREHPMVSIGLPLYSGGTNLADAIESILSQDYEDIELIISDHGVDPFVSEIGHYYQKLDKRVKYVHSGDQINYLGIHNFARMIELSTATYFMWGSYDDRLEKSFISRCLATIESDDSIALVYPRSKVYNKKGVFLGLGADSVKADSDDAFDRFIHVIWELQMCHAFHGLFRRSYMRKTHSLRKNCYAHDNLFLAEIALLGKIIQINDVLFIRCLTRNYNLRLDEHHADVLHSADPIYLEEGLTLPFCRFTYAHCELVNHSSLPPERKESLTQEILRCFKRRWAMQLNYEINRLIHFLKNGVYYQTWDGRTYNHDLRKRTPNLHYFHVTDVLKSIREALFIFPEHQELQKIYESSIANIKIPERTVIIPTQVHQEVR